MTDEVASEADADAKKRERAERRKLDKLDKEFLIDDVLGLRADLADAKAKAKKQAEEIRKLKDLNTAFQGEPYEVIRRFAKIIEAKSSEMFRANEKAAAALRQVYVLKKRVKELEAMEIPL